MSVAGKSDRLKMVVEQVKHGIGQAWHAHLRGNVSCSAGMGRNRRYWDSSMRNIGKSLSGDHYWGQ